MKTNGPIPVFLAPFLYFLLLPLTLLFIVLNEIFRIIISAILEFRYEGKITLISDGADALWGYTNSRNSRNVIVTALYKSGESTPSSQKRADMFTEKVLNYQDKDGNKPYSKFKKILIQSHGYTCWKECEDFDAKNHFYTINPEKIHSKQDVQDIIAQFSKDMEESKPQWEFVKIPRYKESEDDDEKEIDIARFQHAYMDGLSVVLMLSKHVAENFELTLDPLTFSIPLWKRVLFYVNCLLYGPYAFILLTWNKYMVSSWVKTSLKPGKRNVTWAKSVEMATIQKIRMETRVTVTNIVSTAFVAAAKRVLPADRLLDEILSGEIVAMLPYPNSNPQNRFTVFSYPIPTVEEDILEKLIRSKKDSLEAIIGPMIILYYLGFKIYGRFPPALLGLLMTGEYESFILSNVPGSKQPFKLFGAEVEELAAWPPQPNDTGITITSLSYKGTLKICGIADSSWLTKEELERIYEEMPKVINSMAGIEILPSEDKIPQKIDMNGNHSKIKENSDTEDEFDEETESEESDEET